MRYSLDYLESLPTLHVGQFHDLKIEEGNTRTWLSRVHGPRSRVEVEEYKNGKWITERSYIPSER